MAHADDQGLRLSRLFIHPVKSLRGVEVRRATLTRRGLVGDRRFMIVDERGHFVTQRELHAMATLTPRLEDDALILTGPTGSPLRVPRQPSEGPLRRVRVWEDDVQALDLGDEAARWLQSALGQSLRLVYMPEDTVRPVDPTYGAPGDVVSFADGFPFLVLTEASLNDLNQRMGASLPMERFRPNLVVDGCEPYAEDGWERVRIGAIPFRLVKPCSRCVMTTLDHESGQPREPSPLTALARYRRLPSGGVCLGQNAVADADGGELSVGATVEVLSTRVPPQFAPASR